MFGLSCQAMPQTNTPEPCDCKVCGKPVPASRRRYRSKTCSRHCSRTDWKERYRAARGIAPINRPTTGAVSELSVAAHCLSLGFSVFRSMCSSAPCDLILLRDGQCIRVEVRTGARHILDTTRLSYPKKTCDIGRSETVAVYAPEDRSITFIPPLHTLTITIKSTLK